MSSQSDPLPYVQVDRAVKPKAGLLARVLECTPQHAIGSLVEWWELCGDPRELEAIVQATPPGEEPAVVLGAEDVAARFSLASGKQVEPMTLVRLGLLETHGEGRFRVRGMSRYFAPVKHRIQARLAAKAGGRARVGAPRNGGKFAPKTTVEGAGAPAGASAGERLVGLQPPLHPETSRQPADTPAGDQPATSRAPALAYIGQRTAQVEAFGADAPAPSPPAAPKKKPQRVKEAQADPRHAPLVKALVEAFPGYGFQARDAAAVTALLALGTPEEVLARWRRALAHVGHPTVRTTWELATNWNHFGPGYVGRARPGAPVAAESVDWANAEHGEIST